MAVYTELSGEEFSALLGGFGVGPPDHWEGIAGGIENTNYQVTAAGARYVLTVFERGDAAAAEATLRLTERLAAAGFPCPAPVSGPRGVLGAVRGKPVGLVPFVAGAAVAELDVARLESLGRVVAALHQAGAGIPFERPGFHLAAQLVPLARELAARLSPRKAALAELLTEEAGYQEGVPEATLPAGLIHGDIFRDNLLYDPAGPTVRALLDFHLAGRGPWVYDLAVAMLDMCWDANGIDGDRARAFLRGYRRRRPLTGSEHAALPAYLRRGALRFLCLRIQRSYLADCPMRRGKTKDPQELADKLRLLRESGRGEG